LTDRRTVQSNQLQDAGILEAKLELAERILEFSNRNIELTMQILLGSPQEMNPLLRELSENGAAISNLLQKIRKQAESQKERELLDAASSSWLRPHSYTESLQSLFENRRSFDATTATSNIILPLLLDNSSWKAFVHFLRSQAGAGPVEPANELVGATRQLVRAHQEAKSAVAERKRIAERLSQLASIIEYSSDAIVIFTLDGLIVSWNAAAENIYGYSASEVLGRPRRLLLPADHADDLQSVVQRLRRGEKIARFESVHIGKNGQHIHVSMTISPVKDAHEQTIGAAAITRDVSDRKLLEKKLQQAQKMEAIGQLAGGIAHDFNNLLSVINGHCELLAEQLPSEGAAGRNCEQIKKAGERAAGLTRQLLAFSRQQVLEPTVLDLNAVVVDLGKMLKRVIGEDVEFKTSLNLKLDRVKADRGQIEQVIMNLVVNARDAMPEGGLLTIETANVIVDEAFVRDHRPQLPGAYVRLSVRDTGHGMDPETQARIFEPFFTTKEVGKGTGLGLSTAYGVIRQSGGHIWVTSQPGRGSTFDIYFPVVTETVTNERASVMPSPVAGGTETILLVEDEQALRELTRDILLGSGYKLLEAESPEQAIQIARGHAGPIHLLLTDVVMPGINGRVLAQKLMVIRPEMKVLYMSGYAGFKHSQMAGLESVLLAKPFKRDMLLRKIRETLAAVESHALR